MDIKKITEVIEGRIVCGNTKSPQQKDVEYAFASDLMSDVLTINSDNILLITGLSNIQTIRTAEMADISYIVFARNKRPSAEMIEIANENNIVLIECDSSMYNISGKLYQAGLKALY